MIQNGLTPLQMRQIDRRVKNLEELAIHTSLALLSVTNDVPHDIRDRILSCMSRMANENSKLKEMIVGAGFEI